MREYQLTKEHPFRQAKAFLNDSDFDLLVDESAKVYDPDNNLLFVLAKNAVDIGEIKKAWPIIREINEDGRNRFTSSGEYVANNSTTHVGTKQQRMDDPITSGIIGFFDRTPRRPFCRKCAWTFHHGSEWLALTPLFQKISDVYQEVWPEKWNYQKEFYDKTHEDFKIPGTIFTTVTVNKNYRTACHLDPKNLEKSASAMLVIRQGNYLGGHLVLPKWRIAFKLDTADLVLFDGAEEWHGNTAIEPITKNYQRASLVCYFRQNMIHCGSAEEEQERAKRRKPGDSLSA